MPVEEKTRRFKILCLLEFFLFSFLLVYFKILKIFVSPTINDAVIICIFSSIIILLVPLIFSSNCRNRIFITLVLTSVFSIMVRLVTPIQSFSPWMSDGIYYFISTKNIIEYGTLTPMLDTYYPLSIAHLNWPIMEILSAMIVQIGNFSYNEIILFQGALLGFVFTLGCYILTYSVTKNSIISLIAALTASLGDMIIYFQMEYHPNGFAIILFVFFIYAYIKSRNGKERTTKNMVLCMLIISLALIFSHHFFSLLLTIFALLFVSINVLFNIIVKKSIKVERLYTPWIIIIILGLTINIIFYKYFIEILMGMMNSVEPNGELLFNYNNNFINIINTSKWIILFISLPSCIYALFRGSEANRILLFILISIVFAGVISVFISGGDVTRLMLPYIPLISIYFSMTIYSIYNINIINIKIRNTLKRKILNLLNKSLKIIIVMLVCFLLTSSIYNSQVQSFFFSQDSFQKTRGDVDLIQKASENPSIGGWVQMNIDYDSRFLINDVGGQPILLYYAKIPAGSFTRDYTDLNIDYFLISNEPPSSSDYPNNFSLRNMSCNEGKIFCSQSYTIFTAD